MAPGPLQPPSYRRAESISGSNIATERRLSHAEGSRETGRVSPNAGRIPHRRTAFQGRPTGVTRRGFRTEHDAGGTQVWRRVGPAPTRTSSRQLSDYAWRPGPG